MQQTLKRNHLYKRYSFQSFHNDDISKFNCNYYKICVNLHLVLMISDLNVVFIHLAQRLCLISCNQFLVLKMSCVARKLRPTLKRNDTKKVHTITLKDVQDLMNLKEFQLKIIIIMRKRNFCIVSSIHFTSTRVSDFYIKEILQLYNFVLV